ncbi:MAG: rhodanese-like domain-containing protein [Planctomycetes bacterium]|nr:rhodanese-like domain-containing protein [Planctomycetota bacterium]
MTALRNSIKINLRTWLFLAGVILIASNSCVWAHTDVTHQQARDLIDSTNDLIIIDVREPFEYCDDIGHIPWALNYPLSSGILETRYEELPMHSPILVVCRSGGRSNRAANFLDSKGFSMVYDMMGGMNAWIWETEPCKTGDNETVSVETNTYVFLPDQSTLLQTGGIAGVNWNYSVEGHFQLTIDKDAGTGSFAFVDANAIDDSPFERTLDPNEVFNMTSLLGIVLNETTISFTTIATDGSDIRITATIEDDLAYLVGETVPPPNTADFFMFSLDAIAQRKYGGGSGEPNNPYLIYTAEQMNAIGLNLGDRRDKHFKLMEDIDLSAYTGTDFNIIGLISGVFDGNGHTISNFSYTTTTGPGGGLFRNVGGVIKDLGLINPNVDLGGGTHAGSLAYSVSYGTISNCYAEGASVSGYDYAGGLVGYNYRGTITNCTSSGSVSGNDDVGGLVGHNYDGTITDCYTSVSVSGDDYVGGLVGGNYGTISNCYAAGSVSGSGTVRLLSGVGGLVGYNKGTISDCSSAGSVSGTAKVGGLVGGNYNAYIENCYATGSVSGTTYVGGLLGENWYGTINNCYSVGRVTGTTDVGGLVALNSGVVTHSFWDIETSGHLTSAGGTGKTTAEMQTASTFLDVGWDFVNETANGPNDVWKISEGLDYPRLWWEKYSGGTGELNAPYRIATAEDLIILGDSPEDYDKQFILTADIDLDPNLPSRKVFDRAVIAPDLDPNDEYTMFQGTSFMGVFNGDDHKIIHLTIEGGNYLGLFGKLDSEARISQIFLEAVDIKGAERNIGSLVGESHGILIQCHSTGVVSGEIAVGGLVGVNEGNVTKSYSTGDVYGFYFVGGLVGDNWGSITESYSISAISGEGDVGGLAGFIGATGNVIMCYSTSTVTGNWHVGGLVGSNYSSITESHSTGRSTGNEEVGGLVGENGGGGSITESYSTGMVNGIWYVGGLAGRNIGSIKNSYTTGDASGNSAVGGLVGSNGYIHTLDLNWEIPGSISNCYSAGSVSGTSEVGGLVGIHYVGSVTASFWDMETSGQAESAGGEDKTTAEMQTLSTFIGAGWDFIDETENGTEEIWWILEGQDYPRLWWELIPEN